MQDIKTDFYKIFSRGTGIADSIFCPYSAALFGGGNLPVLGVRLSFGAHAAFRKRSDDRIILSRTSSDVRAEVNKINIERLRSPAWARNILMSMSQLPISLGGIEMLLHCDATSPELSTERLCAVYATAQAFSPSISPSIILHSAEAGAQYMPSITQKRAAVINTVNFDYIPYDFSLPDHKIIIARIPARRSNPKLTNSFRERELKRLNKASDALTGGDVLSLAPIMNTASRDMLSEHKKAAAKLLFTLCCDFTDAVRIMSDYLGAVIFVPAKKVDEFLLVVTERYEKKTGTRPAFYISD